MECNYCNIVPDKNCTFCIVCKEYYCNNNCGRMTIDMKLPYYALAKICLDHTIECVECGENRALKTDYECFYCNKLCNSMCLECLYQKQWKKYLNCYSGDYDGVCVEFATIDENTMVSNSTITMICPDCTKITYDCEICGKDYCKGCKNECYTCGLYICQDCYFECETCNRAICRDCTIWVEEDTTTCPYDCVLTNNNISMGVDSVIDIYKKLLSIKDKELAKLVNVKSINETLQTENETLQEENQHLRLELEFVPGGSGYQVAKEHFESFT